MRPTTHLRAITTLRPVRVVVASATMLRVRLWPLWVLCAVSSACGGGGSPDTGQDVAIEAGMDATEEPVPCGSTTCTGGLACCPATSQCFDPSCLTCCMAAPDVEPNTDDSPPLMGPPCHVAGDCAGGNQCVFATAGCGTIGVCQPDEPCFRPLGMFCGCDGQTETETCAGPPGPWTAMGACAGDAGE